MGVMLYLMLTGTYPFEDHSQPANIKAGPGARGSTLHAPRPTPAASFSTSYTLVSACLVE